MHCAVSLVGGFCRKKTLSHLKTPKTVAMETKVCNVIKFFTSFQRNFLWDNLLCFGHHNALRSGNRK